MTSFCWVHHHPGDSRVEVQDRGPGNFSILACLRSSCGLYPKQAYPRVFWHGTDFARSDVSLVEEDLIERRPTRRNSKMNNGSDTQQALTLIKSYMANDWRSGII